MDVHYNPKAENTSDNLGYTAVFFFYCNKCKAGHLFGISVTRFIKQAAKTGICHYGIALHTGNFFLKLFQDDAKQMVKWVINKRTYHGDTQQRCGNQQKPVLCNRIDPGFVLSLLPRQYVVSKLKSDQEQTYSM